MVLLTKIFSQWNCVLAKRTLADKGQELETINDILTAVIPFKAGFP